MRRLLRESGFTDEAHLTRHPDETLQRWDEYVRADGPLSAACRATDSTWALCTPGELDRAMHRVQDELRDDADGWERAVLKRAQQAKRIGQTVTYTTRRPR